MKKVLYPILAVFAFVIMQTVAGVAMVVAAIIKDPDLLKEMAKKGDPNAFAETLMSAETLAWTVIISGILTIGVIALLKMIDWKQVFCFKCINWKLGIISIVGAILGILALGIVEEMLDLPDLMENQWTDLSNSLIGALAIGLIGPIIEEFIFREAVLGYMLRGGVNKWVAIVSSGLAFGLIHMNPAQIPFAASIGIILGIIYYKTGNIVITCILHILNNSMAVWQMYTMGEAAKEFSLIEWLGGQGYAVGIGCAVAILSFVLLRHFWKSYLSAQWNNIQQTEQLTNQTTQYETVL